MTLHPQILAVPTLLVAIGAHAASVEQVQDISVHTALGTQPTNVTVKAGLNFDSGDGVALLKWDENDAAFAGPLAEAIGEFRPISGDGSVSIHQMLVPWDQSTDYGTTLPVPGVDYIPQAIAAVGFNDTDRVDEADFTLLAEYWRANPAQNFGIILVPRGALNGSYPGSFDPGAAFAAIERVAGLDADDTRIITLVGTSTQLDQVLEPMEDSIIDSGSPDTTFRDSPVLSAGVDGGDTICALYKFGMGALRIKNPGATITFSVANFLVNSIAAIDPEVTFDVHRMLVDWDEATVTWNQFGGGGPQPVTHYDAAPLGSLTLGNGVGAAAINILATAQDWYDNPATNFGVILVPRVGTTSLQGLISSERVFPGLDADDSRLALSFDVLPGFQVTEISVGDVEAFQFTSVADTTYVLEYSTDGGLQWQSSGLTIAGTGGNHTVFDPTGTDTGRTYRLSIVSAPPAGGGPANYVDETATRFTGPGGLAALRACFADFDQDGWTDLCDGERIHRNVNGTGFSVFYPVTGARTWGDFNNDGYPDLAVPRKPEFPLPSGTGLPPGVMWNLSGGGFAFVALPAPSPVPFSRGSCWGDWNLDLYDDLHVGGYEWPNFSGSTQADTRYHSTAGTGFSQAWTETVYRARGISACDFDEDGDLDIYVSNYRQQPNRLWQNNGAGNFTDVAAALGVDGDNPPVAPSLNAYGHTIGSAWGDLDNDGLFDLFVGNFNHHDSRWSDESKFLRNRGSGFGYDFEQMDELDGADWKESYASPVLGDYDNDGDLDLYLTTAFSGETDVLYRNDGGWVFTEVAGTVGLGGVNGANYQAAFADIDNDGDLDLVSAAKLFVNQGTGNNWLRVRLAGNGTTVNRMAIGSKVRFTIPGKTLIRQVEAGTGEGNMNEPTLHFGLGSHALPLDLKVIWNATTGLETQIVNNVLVNQLITVEQP